MRATRVNNGDVPVLLIGAAMLALVLVLVGVVGWHEATRGRLIIGCPAGGGFCGVAMRT
jgi:hypothetical protein